MTTSVAKNVVVQPPSKARSGKSSVENWRLAVWLEFMMPEMLGLARR
jgi:hypothetical protein